MAHRPKVTRELKICGPRKGPDFQAIISVFERHCQGRIKGAISVIRHDTFDGTAFYVLTQNILCFTSGLGLALGQTNILCNLTFEVQFEKYCQGRIRFKVEQIFLQIWQMLGDNSVVTCNKNNKMQKAEFCHGLRLYSLSNLVVKLALGIANLPWLASALSYLLSYLLHMELVSVSRLETNFCESRSRDKFLRVSVSKVSGLVSVSKATGLGHRRLS